MALKAKDVFANVDDNPFTPGTLITVDVDLRGYPALQSVVLHRADGFRGLPRQYSYGVLHETVAFAQCLGNGAERIEFTPSGCHLTLIPGACDETIVARLEEHLDQHNLLKRELADATA